MKAKKKRKQVLGITGGFGTGKSTVAGLLRRSGFLVLDADRIAHETLQGTNPVYRDICAKFPDAVSHGFLARAKLAEIVFKDPKQLRRLERIIHPYVKKRMLEEVRKSKKKQIALEVPLLFEAGFQKICDLTLTIVSDKKSSEKRLLSQGWTLTEIRRRTAAQWPLKKKAARSDFVIDNSGSRQDTRRQVQNFLKAITQPKKG